MFSVQTSVVPRMTVSEKAEATTSAFYLKLHSLKSKNKTGTFMGDKFLEQGTFHDDLLLVELTEDGTGFNNFVRMSTSDFELRCTDIHSSPLQHDQNMWG